MNKWLRLAARIASANMCIGKNFSLGAVLIKGGSIIATGVNKKKTDPIVKILSERSIKDTHKYRSWMHAELDCINRIPIEVTKNAILYVARVTHDHKLANARPCIICRGEIAKAGIRRVNYTLDEMRDVVLYFSPKDREFINDESTHTQRNATWEKRSGVWTIQCA